jgi:hypothetical protein
MEECVYMYSFMIVEIMARNQYQMLLSSSQPVNKQENTQKVMYCGQQLAAPHLQDLALDTSS